MTTTVPPVTVDGDPRVVRSRAKLLAAATELLVESGPRAVTVDAVAERSGVAKSTLYRHWPSRNDLLLAVMRSHVPDTPPVDLSRGFEAALRSQMQIAVGVLSDPEWLRILPALVSLQHHVPEMAELMAADRDAKLTMLREVINLGVAERRLPVGVEPLTVLHLLIGPLMFAVISGDADRLPLLADEVVARFLASYR